MKFYLVSTSELDSGLMELRFSPAWGGNLGSMEVPMADQGKRNLPSPGDIEETQHPMLTTVNSHSHTLIPPLGYKIAGVAGSSASWVDGFSLIIQH